MANAGLQLRERFNDEFLARIFQWSQQHADSVGSAYVVMRDGTLTVFAIGLRDEYDFDLDDPISDLEVEMEDKGWACDIVQLPACDIDSKRAFFDEDKSIEVYAKRS